MRIILEAIKQTKKSANQISVWFQLVQTSTTPIRIKRNDCTV